MATNLARAQAVVPAIGATDLLLKKGSLVTLSASSAGANAVLTATLSASATVPATGIIIEPGSGTTGVSTIGILGAMDGTIWMKLGGTVAAGARVQQNSDDTVITDAGAGNARVVVGVAIQGGVSGDLIEVAPLSPMILP